MATLFENVQVAAQTGRVMLVLVIAALAIWALGSLNLKVLGTVIAAAGLALLIWFPGRPEHQHEEFRSTAIKISLITIVIGLLLIVFG